MKANIISISILFYTISLLSSDHSDVNQRYKSSHVHTLHHDKKMGEIYALGTSFDKELEKAKCGHVYNLQPILKAMHDLALTIECLPCRTSYQSAIFENENKIIPDVEAQLKDGRLPRILTDD